MTWEWKKSVAIGEKWKKNVCGQHTKIRAQAVVFCKKKVCYLQSKLGQLEVYKYVLTTHNKIGDDFVLGGLVARLSTSSTQFLAEEKQQTSKIQSRTGRLG